MNTSFVKSAPMGDFAEVSALRRGWQTKFQSLVTHHQAIKFDFYPLPGVPAEIKNELEQAGYQDLVLENDQWQHYLVPQPHQFAATMRLAA